MEATVVTLLGGLPFVSPLLRKTRHEDTVLLLALGPTTDNGGSFHEGAIELP